MFRASVMLLAMVLFCTIIFLISINFFGIQ